MTEKEEGIKAFKTYFKGIMDGDKPLAKLFRTDSCGYLYDTGTNKILGCGDEVFELLENLFSLETGDAIDRFIGARGMEVFLEAADTIKDSIENENVLRVKKAVPFGVSKNCPDYEDLIDSSFEILFLEVDEACNLRCDYCIYNDHVKGKRNHGKRQMSLETAKRAIDYLHAHSFKRNKVAVTNAAKIRL